MASLLCYIKEQVEALIHGLSGGGQSQPSSESTKQMMFSDEITWEMKEASRLATDFETNMGKVAAIKMWLPGVCFAMCMSLACILEGYGLVLIAGFFASPKFKTDFGCPVTQSQDFDCEIPTAWQTGLVNGALVGQMIGIGLNGWLTEKYGYRKTFLGAVYSISAFFCITFFANNLWVLLVGFILCGIPWGIFQTLTTSYASDVCPTPIRAYFTMWTNLCWVFGQLMGASVQRALVDTTSVWNYKIPFILQWAFPLPIILAGILAPESPWWLMRQGRHKDVFIAMDTLRSKKPAPLGYSIENHVKMCFVTNKEEENDVTNGGGTMGYRDCFKGVNSRRTINTCAIWAIQNACGAALMQFSTYFFLQAGLGEEWAFTFTMIQYGIGILGTVISWGLVTRIGRRTLFLSGLVVLLAFLIIIGIISVLPIPQGCSGLAIGSLLMVFTLAYNCTVGPVTYSLVSELPSTRLKSKTINMARACYLLVGLLNGAATPIMLNPQALNWGAKTAWFWAGMTLLCAIYTFFEVPEPKDLTFGQIDYLYASRVPARRFKAEGQELRLLNSQPGTPTSEDDLSSNAISWQLLSQAVTHAVANAAATAVAEVANGAIPLTPLTALGAFVSPLGAPDRPEQLYQTAPPPTDTLRNARSTTLSSGETLRGTVQGDQSVGCLWETLTIGDYSLNEQILTRSVTV